MNAIGLPVLCVSFGVALSLITSGCIMRAPVPVKEYTLAKSALEGAMHYDAARLSPGYWHKANQNYRKGRKALKEGNTGGAKEFFHKARIFAEKAENVTRLKKYRAGEGF